MRAEAFESLAPDPGVIDDGSSTGAIIRIERALGIEPVPDTFWSAAFAHRFVDVVRLLEAEMAARAIDRLRREGFLRRR